MEDCHWIKTLGPAKVIIKCSKRKDANKVRSENKQLKGKNLTSLGINTPIYINDSLCTYYKKLLSKCKKLCDNKAIHTFWISNGSVNLKVSETGNVHTVSHGVVGFCSLVTILLRTCKGCRFSFYLNWVCVSWSDNCVSVLFSNLSVIISDY